MRAWLVIALVGCGHERPTKPELQTHDRTGSATVSAADAMGPDDDGVGRRIADELVALPSNRLVYLLDLGWIPTELPRPFSVLPNLVVEVY